VELVRVALVLVVAAVLAGCGEEVVPTPAAPITTTTSTTAAPLPTELRVECTADATTVSPDRVAARPDGLHVEVVNTTERKLQVMAESVGAPFRWRGAYIPSGKQVVGIAPGTVHLRCVDLDQPEHMEPVFGNPETKVVQVEAEQNAWAQPVELTGCPGPMSSLISDFVADDQPHREPVDEPEDAVRRDSHLAQYLRPDDELRRVGYRVSDHPTVAVLRRGSVIAIVGLQVHSGRWVVGSIDTCEQALKQG
jgi:hypothetical protein